jgi:hypothetical protein
VPLLVGLHDGIAGIRNVQGVGRRLAEEALRLWMQMRQPVLVWDVGHCDFARLQELLEKLQGQFGEMALGSA